jgi:hypothetical protein
MSETYVMKEYSGRGKNATCVEVTYQRLTLDEVKALCQGQRVDFLSRQGTIKQVTITSVKTWKTRADVHVGLKYGLYQYSYTEYQVNKESGHISMQGEILVRRVDCNDQN